jgi:AcrR family transcriptional regulator
MATDTDFDDVRPGRRRPRQNRSKRTQQFILDAARSCFDVTGFTVTTIKDIAGAAGVSVGAIYEHFKDKSTLFREVGHMEALRMRDESFRPFQEALGAETLTAITAVDLIRLGIRGSVESQKRYPRLLAELVERTPHDPELLHFINQIHVDATQFIERLIVLFGARTEGAEAARAANIIFPMCEATVRHFALRPSSLTEEEVIEELTNVAVRYLFPGEGITAPGGDV